MSRRRRISYNTYTIVRSCRQRFKMQKIDYIPSVKPVDMRNAIYGFVMQRLAELFYTKEWYRAGKKTGQVLFDELPGVMKEQIAEHACPWEHRSEVELLERDCQEAIPKFIQVVRAEKLLGEKNEAEKPVEYDLSTQFKLTGRMDFLISRGGKKILLDGKGTKYRDKYLDREQLIFYMLVMRLMKQKLPEKQGFWLWRDGEVLWQGISEKEIDDLFLKIKEGLFLLQKKDFSANPCTKSCRFCPYKGPECRAYTEWHKVNQRKRSKKLQETIGSIDPIGDGLVEISDGCS